MDSCKIRGIEICTELFSISMSYSANRDLPISHLISGSLGRCLRSLCSTVELPIPSEMKSQHNFA